MILVTVGTTLTFDDLIQTVDELAAAQFFDEKVICQIGHGSYIPKHCEYFKFQKNLDALIDQASLIVCHGGTGSTLELLIKEKRFVAVANPKGADNHQAQFLTRLGQQTPILWTADLQQLATMIDKARHHEYQASNLPHLADDLLEYLSACQK